MNKIKINLVFYMKIKHIYLQILMNMTLDHKTSLKSHRYICSNSQQYIVWVKILIFLLCQKSLGY